MIWTDIKDNLYIHQGNSGNLEVSLTYQNAPYTMNALDVLVLSVKETISETADSVIYKEVEGTNIISFLPADTEQLLDKAYYYDVKLFLNTAEEITVVSPKFFFVKSVLTLDKEVEEVLT